MTIATKLEDPNISYYLLVSLCFVAEINPYSFFKFIFLVCLLFTVYYNNIFGWLAGAKTLQAPA